MKKIREIKHSVIMTVKETNVPKDYKILSKIAGGYVLVISKDFSTHLNDKGIEK